MYNENKRTTMSSYIIKNVLLVVMAHPQSQTAEIKKK